MDYCTLNNGIHKDAIMNQLTQLKEAKTDLDDSKFSYTKKNPQYRPSLQLKADQPAQTIKVLLRKQRAPTKQYEPLTNDI